MRFDDEAFNNIHAFCINYTLVCCKVAKTVESMAFVASLQTNSFRSLANLWNARGAHTLASGRCTQIYEMRTLRDYVATPAPSTTGTAAYRSWGGEVADWEGEQEVEELTEGDMIDSATILPDGGGGPEYGFQNALAAVLLGALVLASANILLKLGFVAAALIAAAFRYTALALLVVVLLAIFS
jgi:hypothetical protein